MKNIFLFVPLFIGTFIYANTVHIVGSSTVYPFSSAAAEELGDTTKYKTPLVESTGSGGGFKLFCSGSGKNTPDITNASRRIKNSEFKKCKKNGVYPITEAMIGYDGIMVAQSRSNKNLNLTRKQILLAVAKRVPNKSNTKLILNPYTFWNQIDSSLPERKIRIYGPPTSSGTRDAFEELVLQKLTKKMPVYRKSGFKKYSKIRQDGVYIPSGENDNLIVKKLNKDKIALGVFGYSFLQENEHAIKASRVDGVSPKVKNIANGSYPISRSLFFYIKNSKKKNSISAYVSLIMSDDMIGEDGYLSELGLIPLSKKLRQKIQQNVKSRKTLTLNSLKK